MHFVVERENKILNRFSNNIKYKMLLKSIKNLKISSEIYYSSDDTLNMTGLHQRDKLRGGQWPKCGGVELQ